MLKMNFLLSIFRVLERSNGFAGFGTIRRSGGGAVDVLCCAGGGSGLPAAPVEIPILEVIIGGRSYREVPTGGTELD